MCLSCRCRASIAIATGLVAVIVMAREASADRSGRDTAILEAPTLEVWAGADVTARAWSTWSGVTLSPWSGIHDPGWKFRVVAGGGRYRYDRAVATQTWSGQTEIAVTSGFMDALAGYQMVWGPLTLKTFAGIAAVGRLVDPADSAMVAEVFSHDIGVRTAAELWIDITSWSFGQLDVAWVSAGNELSARSRIGMRTIPELSLGLELAGLVQEGRRDARLGGFIRYEWMSGEVSFSGGVVGESTREAEPYATVNVTWRR